MYTLVNFKTREPVTPTNYIFTSPDSPWEVMMDLDRVRTQINIDYFRKAPPFVSKYLPFMPIKDFSKFVSLGEGATPLIQSKKIGEMLGIELYFKLESQNPTGSFKDRGSAVELTIARELGVKGIAVASTGNMAASCSCYAAAAQIPCFVFVPEDTPTSKLSQVIAYGGRIVQVKGGYNDAVKLSQEVAEKLNFYLAGDYAFRVEGHKTAAFELLDQLFFRAPEIVVVPIGCGTNITSYAKGFKEYRELGFITETPQLIGVQAAGACPVVNSFMSGSREITPVEKVETIASAIAIADPLDGIKALDAIYSTNGQAVAVTDKEFLEAQYLLSKEEGLFVESSCATSLAAIIKLNQDGSLKGKRVVCVLTGGGLKDPTSILRVAIKPPTIHPNISDFLSLYNNSFFEGKTVSFVDRESVIFSTEPTEEELKNLLKKHFEQSYSDEYVRRIQELIGKILKKGKPVTFSDLQDTVQDALETLQNKAAAIFSVKDFEVHTGKDRKANARVVVTVNGKTVEGTGEGVGPVDSVINALRKILDGTFEFSLTGYKVHVRSQGTNAVVYVELKLIRGNTVSLGKGTSPDIIQASIEAFEEAYNGFFE